MPRWQRGAILSIAAAAAVLASLDVASPARAAPPPATMPANAVVATADPAFASTMQALVGRAAKINGTWSIETRSTRPAPTRWVLSVSPVGWLLAEETIPSTRPASQPSVAAAGPTIRFYGDGQYIYDLQRLERMTYAAGLNRLPQVPVMRFLLATIEPAAVLKTFGELGSATEVSQANGGPRLRLRFVPPAATPTPRTAPAVVGRDVHATDVYVDRSSFRILAIRNASLLDGSGQQASADDEAATDQVVIASSVTITAGYVDGSGAFQSADAMLVADLARTAADDSQASAARDRVKDAAFFATPQDALEPASVYQSRIDVGTATRSDEVALAEVAFANRDANDGLQRWDDIDRELAAAARPAAGDAADASNEGMADRQRLAAVLAVPAAATAWLTAAADHARSVEADVALVAKLADATDATAWRTAAPYVLFTRDALEKRQLSLASIRTLDGRILERLCASGNRSVVAQLLARATSGDDAAAKIYAATDGVIAGRQLANKRRGEGAQAAAGDGSTSPTDLELRVGVVAAAFDVDDAGRAARWASTLLADDNLGAQARLRLNAVQRAASVGPSDDPTAAVDAYVKLSEPAMSGDASAVAAQQWLVRRTAGSLARSGVGTRDPVRPTAGVAGGASFWDDVVGQLVGGGGGTPHGDVALSLADDYADVYRQPAYRETTLLRLAAAADGVPGGRAAEAGYLQAALASAPSEADKRAPLSAMVEFYLRLAEPDVAAARVTAARSSLRDPASIAMADALSRDIDTWRAAQTRTGRAAELRVEADRARGIAETFR